jgi:hypothetical protein
MKIVGKGDPGFPVSGGVFEDFSDPVSAANRNLVFQATLALNPKTGITNKNNAGLWRYTLERNVELLGLEGSPATGVGGGAVFNTFTSYALPEGKCGPIFTATLAKGSSGATSGLWAVDSLGTTQLLACGGQMINNKTIKSMTLLDRIPGSEAQRRSFNDKGQIIWLANYNDNTTAIVLTTLP